jgi:hypothetical protein
LRVREIAAGLGEPRLEIELLVDPNEDHHRSNA